MYHEYYNRTPERLALAKQAIDRALSLQPDLPAGHFALGVYYFRGLLDFDRALEQFDLVLQKQPDNTEGHRLLGGLRRRQGDFENDLQHTARLRAGGGDF
jgi:lipoprotein NlpI